MEHCLLASQPKLVVDEALVEQELVLVVQGLETTRHLSDSAQRKQNKNKYDLPRGGSYVN